MSTLATNAITDASGGNTATINSFTPTVSNMAGRNRIINGDMRIDQRNAGASVTPTTGTYTLDRFRAYQNVASKFTVQRSSVAPAGFTNSALITSTSAYTASGTDLFLFMQYIEGFNVADLGWGTANAATVTLSFWVRSSLTGTFGGAILNGAEDRNYPFTYTISAANTWEQKAITIPGDTTGTWLTTNGLGMEVNFGLGAGATYSGTAGAWAAGAKFTATGAVSVVGTNGATFYITGVQLEAGSVATPFERRLYGQELALCQRYCWQVTYESGDAAVAATGYWGNGTVFEGFMQPPVTMRAFPTLTISGTVQALKAQTGWYNVNSIGLNGGSSSGVKYGFDTNNSGEARGLGGMIGLRASGAYARLTAEL